MTNTQNITQLSTETLDTATMPTASRTHLSSTALLLIASFIASAAEQASAVAQERGNKPSSNLKSDDNISLQITPALRASPTFQAGYAEGRLAGRLEGVLGYLKRDIAAVSDAVEKNGTAQEKLEWRKQQEQIEKRISNIENGLAGKVVGFNLVTASTELQADIRVVNTYNLLTARMVKSELTTPQQNSIALPGGKLQLEHGEIVALDIYRKLVQPLVDDFAKGGGLRLSPNPQGGGIANPIPPATQRQIEGGLGNFKNWFQNSLKQDQQRILQKREADKKARQR